jgi:outer membrane lipoprotein-sorting protein
LPSLRSLGKLHLIALLTLGAVFPASGWAAETPVTENELATKLRYYSSIRALEADFRQVKNLREMGMQMKSEGRLTLRRPDSVIWEVTKPARVKVELTSAGIRITSGEGTTATVQSFSAAQMPKDGDALGLHDLVAWLRLDAHALSEQYTITRTTTDHFIFAPKKIGPFKTMEMDLSGAGQLTKLVLNESSGDQMTLQFGKPHLLKDAKP